MVWLRISLIALAVVFTFGCAKDFIKPNQAQIDAYIQANPDLPEYDKQCIYDGRFEIGIQQKTLEFLLGKPKTIDMVKQPWAMQERWVYAKSGQKIFILEDKHVVGILERE